MHLISTTHLCTLHSGLVQLVEPVSSSAKWCYIEDNTTMKGMENQPS